MSTTIYNTAAGYVSEHKVSEAVARSLLANEEWHRTRAEADARLAGAADFPPTPGEAPPDVPDLPAPDAAPTPQN